MNLGIHYLKYSSRPFFLFIVVVFVALFAQKNRDWLLPVLFLLLPFADRLWLMPRILWGKWFQISWVVLVVVAAVLLFQNPEVFDVFTLMVLVAALPEEWFFRAYMQKRLGNSVAVVLLVSLMFSFMHYITSGSIVAWLVFLPSVFFGWIYKKTSDLVLVAMLHALSNLVFYIYLEIHVVAFFGT